MSLHALARLSPDQAQSMRTGMRSFSKWTARKLAVVRFRCACSLARLISPCAGMDVLDSDDEIYGLNLPDNSSEEEAIEEDDDEEVLGEDEDGDEEQTSYPPREASPPRGRFAKDVDPTQDILSDAESVADAAESSDEETWAPHMYHVSRKAPGEADSEDDEALDMEAEEARRLQKKYRGVLAGEDYGFGEEAEDEGELETVRQQSRLGGRLEDAATAAAGLVGDAPVYQSEEEAISFLLKKQPETLALLDDFSETAERMKNVEKALVIVRQGEDGKEHPALAIMELEHRSSLPCSCCTSLTRTNRGDVDLPPHPRLLLFAPAGPVPVSRAACQGARPPHLDPIRARHDGGARPHRREHGLVGRGFVRGGRR